LKCSTANADSLTGSEHGVNAVRVLYDVDEVDRVVTILIIGEKRGNQLIVQGTEFFEHESN
jgi:hypothetical protein